MSRFDEIVDQLAFGSTNPKLASCLGLYLSPETIYVSETRAGRDGKLVVDHLVRIPIPQDAKASATATATMNTDFLADPLKVAGLVRQSMSQIRWGTKSVRVTLSHHLGLLRFFPMPPVERRFMRSAVPLEAKKYIPIPFDALAYDWQTTPMPPDAAGRARQGVLIAVTQKKNLTSVEELTTALGLNLVGVEAAPCSVLRLWQAVEPPKGPGPYAQVHFDGGSVRIMIVDAGIPVFFREMFLGQEAGLADQRKVDLAGCASFVQKQLNLPAISRVRVGGVNASLDQWREAFGAEAGAPAEHSDAAKLLSIKGGDWGGLASLGASAKDLSVSPLSLDLAAVNRVSDEERQVARNVFLAGGALAAFLAVVGLYRSASYGLKARELSAYAVEPEVKLALGGRPAADVEQQLSDMQAQLDQLRVLSEARRMSLSSVIRDVVTVMPERIWLVHLEVSSPLNPSPGRSGAEITIRGRAHGQTIGDEQDLVFQFEEALRRSPVGANFEIQRSFRAQPPTDDASGLDPRALAKKLEERTEFTLKLRSKKA